jgi:tRNA(fMet)-specific endonuclease VapC
MTPCVIDTDILSEILKQKNLRVVERAEAYFQHFGTFTFSAISWFEIVRGLRAAGSTTKLQRFDEFVSHSLMLPITPRVLDLAADLWVTGHGRRHRTYDADLLIAATALEQGMGLVTGNVDHFSWVPNLAVEDWRSSSDAGPAAGYALLTSGLGRRIVKKASLFRERRCLCDVPSPNSLARLLGDQPVRFHVPGDPR